ncbi:MAG: TatD family hydrolase [Bacteroidales bacterium]|jgi:TatD DNase family protein|nr:TatD family hydrolase [Bacteroidales bacterium]
MQFIDTHSHLYEEAFSQDITQVIEKAKENGVSKIFLPNIDIQSIESMMRLAKSDSCFETMMGLHPTSVTQNVETELQTIKSHLQNPNSFIGIGEIGIDMYWSSQWQTEQIFAFEQQMKWSLDFNLPVVIHNRSAFDLIISSLKSINSKKYKGIFHCFSGTIKEAEQIIEMGFLLGIGGILTFKNSELQNVIKQIPLSNLVLETDSPYLAPVPYRGKRNESSYISLIAQKLADIKGITLAEVANTTTTAALQVFRSKI